MVTDICVSWWQTIKKHVSVVECPMLWLNWLCQRSAKVKVMKKRICPKYNFITLCNCLLTYLKLTFPNDSFCLPFLCSCFQQSNKIDWCLKNSADCTQTLTVYACVDETWRGGTTHCTRVNWARVFSRSSKIFSFFRGFKSVFHLSSW